MSDMLSFIFLIFIFCILIWGNYGVFVETVVRWSKKPKVVVRNGKKSYVQPKSTMWEKFTACIPGLQVIKLYNVLHTPNIIINIVVGVCCIGMFLNCLFSWFFPFNAVLLFILHWWFLIGFIVMHIFYVVVTVQCALYYDFGKLVVILCCIMPQVFCFYIKNNVPRIMKDLRKADTFKGDTSDTVIKSRSDF